MIGVGIIGCGSIARKRHAVEYQKLQNVKIIGFYDFHRERALEMVDLYGGKVFDSVEEMLEIEEIEAVSVCVANAYHAKISLMALEKGKHVLCEKPMAVTYEECQAMVACAKQMNRKLMIGHNQRLLETHKRAKAILDSGILGKILSFSTTFGHGGPESWSIDNGRNTWFFKKDKAAFGSMADLGIHKIDLIRYLIGMEVESVFSAFATLDKVMENGQPIEVDDNSVDILRFKDGPIGSVTTSWTYYGGERNTTIIYCQKGSIHLYEDDKYSLVIQHEDGSKEYFAYDEIQTNDKGGQKDTGVIRTFVEGLSQEEASVLDGGEALKSMKVVFACLESAKNNCQVNLQDYGHKHIHKIDTEDEA